MADSGSRQHFPLAPTVALYHAECADGFGAAWALWRRFPQARFVPVKHGVPPPEGLKGERVVIVDFSYARDLLETMARETDRLLVLDHHITAEKALAGLPYAYFDMKKSGAVLAWEWAHDHPVPWLLDYIQDKDLWTWALPMSREINAAVASYPFDFQLWNRFKQKELEQEGRAILRYEQELVNKLAGQAVLVEFQGETVPSVQSAILTSQIGERLSAEAPFCIIWHDRDGRRYYSMRSREDGTDVGAIAASFGGGGHTHAAGFSIPLGPMDRCPRIPHCRDPSLIAVVTAPRRAGGHDSAPGRQSHRTHSGRHDHVHRHLRAGLFLPGSLPPTPAEAFVFQYGAIPALLFGQAALPPSIAVGIPAYVTLLTSMFLHGGWMHLIGNMLYLWIFGNNIEDVMGHATFVVFYLACGILAALSHAVTDPTSTIPMVGASGAISGVLGAYILLFPRATCWCSCRESA